MVESERAPALGTPRLFAEHRSRPGLLVRELAWRWSCGSILLALAAFECWRIWSASQAALAGTGIFAYRSQAALPGLLADPVQLLVACSLAVHVLEPQIVRAALGLLPLFVFAWSLAFGFGRTHVLRRWDATIPSRPWLLAQAEALRIGATLGVAALWLAAAALLAAHALLPFALLMSVAAAGTLGMTRLRQALMVGTALALLGGGPLLPRLGPAWRLVRRPALQPLRTEVKKSRLALFALVAVLTFVPSPFSPGWPLVGWWAVWSLPPLAAADAWRLAAFFHLLRTLRGTAA